MRRRSAAPLLVVLTTLLTVLSCSRAGQPLDKPETNFTDVIDPEQNLTFTFADDVVADSLVGRWDTAQALAFTPRVPGQVRWTSPRELTFSPRRPFAPATSYTARLLPAALPKPGKDGAARKLPSETTFKFRTPDLALTAARAYWAGAAGVAGAAEARVQVRLSYPVRPADVGSRLTVRAGGEAVPARVLTTTTSDELTISLPKLNWQGSFESPIPLTVTIAHGLPVPGGAETTPKLLTISTEIPPANELMISEMTGAFAQGTGRLSVFTTQPVITDDVPALVTLTPAVPFSVKALDNGFQLVGDFAAGKTYEVQVSGRLRGAFNTSLERDVKQVVSFGTPPPRVAFSDNTRLFLGAAGARNLALELASVKRVQLTVTKVYESNLQAFLKSGESYGYDYDESYSSGESEYQDRSYRYYDTDAVGDELLSRTVEVAAMPRQGSARLLHLSLQDLEADHALKGIYVIRVRDTERRWLQASQVVVLTDIGLVARQSRAGLLVVASSVATAEPLAGVEISCFSTNNQVVARGTTDADGAVTIKADEIGKNLGGFNQTQDFAAENKTRTAFGERSYDEGEYGSAAKLSPDGRTANRFELGLLTAKKGTDLSMLDLKRSLVDLARYDVGGFVSNAARYMAFCYGDRDLYRPGDTIRAETLVRHPDDWKPVTGVPLQIRLLLPTGRTYQTQRLTLNSQGAGGSRFIIPPTVMTGRWSLEVLTANDVLLDSRTLSVEEFLPDRMRVKVDVARPTVAPGETQTATVTATTLFGPPAAHRRYEAEFSLRMKTFAPKGYDDFDFTLSSEPGSAIASLDRAVKEGETDEQGRATDLTYTVPANLRGMGLLTGTAFAAVFDETGRPVNRLAEFEVMTQYGMIGMGKFDSWRGTDQPLTVPLVVLSAAGKPMPNQPLSVEVVRRVWETVVEREYGRFAYNSQARDQVVLRQTLRTGSDGRTALTYTALASGEYQIRVSLAGEGGNAGLVKDEFYAYGSGNTSANAFAVNTEGRVELSADKPRYRVGDKARVLLKAPFKGKLLVTVERDKVLQRYTVNTSGRAASVDIPLTADCRPNVFVTVTAIRPHGAGGAGGADASPLTVARGYQALLVDAPEAKLPVTINVAEKSRSQRTLPITVKTLPNARLTIAVVDEGILQIKDFKTPDPYGYFYQRRALEVLGYDLYPFLFPERQVGPTGAAVGGDAYNLARRVNPLKSKRVRLVSLWSGELTADGSGNARFVAKIPQFSGALRVMAVAWRNDGFGSAEKEVKVADPVVISAALPRFLSPRDTVDVPVTLTNTTGGAASASATLKVSGPVRIVGSPTASVSIKANSETQVRFRVVAPAGIGDATVEVAVQALGETFRDRTEIPVRPAAALTSFAQSGTIQGGASQTLRFGGTDFLPGTLQARLTVGRSPLARFSDDLRYLIRYPYGCLEQTVSAAFPQLYYGDLAQALGQAPGQAGAQATRFNPQWHVQEAIRKLESMQQPDGSLSYWPGGTETNWWASAYAAHFLTEAQKAGQPVSRPVFDKLLAYLTAQTRPRPTARETVFDAQGNSTQRVIAKREAVYSLYVLALNQQADAAALNYYKANLPLLSMDSRYLLAAAFQISGNAPAARTVLPAAFSTTGQAAVRNLDGDFASPTRDEAISLLALLDAAPNHPTIPTLARRLSQQLGGQRWYSTQERAFALLALGRQAQRDAASTVTATLVQGARQLGAFNGPPLSLDKTLTGQPVQVKTAGKGTLYYTQETEGIPLNGRAVPLVDESLLARRDFLTRDGAPWPTGLSFRQGDLVVVRLTLQSAATVPSVPNVALTDLLPAGLEIENPRLGAQRNLDWAKSTFEPEYLDIRDDRLSLFTTATPTPKVYYYLARAVSAGTYEQAPVTAAAMYDATYRSVSGGGTVRVR